MKNREHICAEVENSLPLFVGGDLEEPAARDVALHLETCAACAQRAEAARSARTLLVSALTLSERRANDLWPGVRERLIAEGVLHEGRPTASVRPARVRRLRLVPMAAAVAAVLFGVWLLRSGPTGHPPYGGVDADANPAPIVDAEPPVVPDLPITPVANDLTRTADGLGLRRVGRDEPRLREGAPIYSDLPFDRGLSTFGESLVAPVMGEIRKY